MPDDSKELRVRFPGAGTVVYRPRPGVNIHDLGIAAPSANDDEAALLMVHMRNETADRLRGAQRPRAPTKTPRTSRRSKATASATVRRTRKAPQIVKTTAAKATTVTTKAPDSRRPRSLVARTLQRFSDRAYAIAPDLQKGFLIGTVILTILVAGARVLSAQHGFALGLPAADAFQNIAPIGPTPPSNYP